MAWLGSYDLHRLAAGLPLLQRRQIPYHCASSQFPSQKATHVDTAR
jgi:hypothetical protein